MSEPQSARQWNICMARVYIAQARNMRRHAGFHAVLLSWASKCRMQAKNYTEQGQLGLF